MRALAPLIMGTGVATAEEIGIETLEQRLREDREKTRAVGCIPMGLCVRATTGPELRWRPDPGRSSRELRAK
jgi:hypothetical protein